MDSICFYGASGHGKVLLDLAIDCNKKVVVFIDDYPALTNIKSIPVVLSKEIENYSNFKFIISIGNNLIRKQISEKIVCNFTKLVHSSAILSESVSILEGTVIMPNVVINTDTKIGKHVIINTAAVVEHDCNIDDFVHISPNVTLTGNVSVGKGTHIGAGSVIIPNIKIGKWVTIGAGSVIIENIPDNAVVVGNPGKIIRYNS